MYTTRLSMGLDTFIHSRSWANSLQQKIRTETCPTVCRKSSSILTSEKPSASAGKIFEKLSSICEITRPMKSSSFWLTCILTAFALHGGRAGTPVYRCKGTVSDPSRHHGVSCFHQFTRRQQVFLRLLWPTHRLIGYVLYLLQKLSRENYRPPSVGILCSVHSFTFGVLMVPRPKQCLVVPLISLSRIVSLERMNWDIVE